MKEQSTKFESLVEAFKAVHASDPLRFAVAVTVDDSMIQGKDEDEMVKSFMTITSGPRFNRMVRIAIRRRKVNLFLSLYKCGFSRDAKFVAKCDKLYSEAVRKEAEEKRAVAEKAKEAALKDDEEATDEAKGKLKGKPK